MTKPVLVIGSRNRKKREELVDLLQILALQVKTLAEFPSAGEVVEDGATFLENATKKAVTLARDLGRSA